MLSLVPPEQIDYLLNKVKRRRRTIFGNIIVKKRKVQAIRTVDIDLQEDERNIEDWDIIDYVDFGPGHRLGKCAYGITLRFMFTVQHKKTNKTNTNNIDYGRF